MAAVHRQDNTDRRICAVLIRTYKGKKSRDQILNRGLCSPHTEPNQEAQDFQGPGGNAATAKGEAATKIMLYIWTTGAGPTLCGGRSSGGSSGFRRAVA